VTHPNADVVRRAYDAFSRGDMDGLGALFTDDITFSIPGRSPLAGEYKGKEAVFGFLQNLMQISGGTVRVDAHAIVAEDEHAVGLMALTAQRNGKRASLNTVHVWHVDDGKLTEFWEFPDQPDYDDFWS
jgi:ketosteroid isomerase-like protein